MSERLFSALFGAFWGALIGAALSWLFGIYSNRMGPSFMPVDARHWGGAGALFFALMGLLFNAGVGTLIGVAIDLIFRFENVDHRGLDAPWLLKLLVLAVAAFAAWRFFMVA